MNDNKPWRAAAALLCLLLAWTAHISPAAAQACAPGTCCGTNPTTGTPACGAAAGNPLNVMSGNKFQREVDMPALPGVLGLELVRYYNSESALTNQRGILGRGWRMSYEAELFLWPGGDRITVVQADGTLMRYYKNLIQSEPGVTVFNSTEPGPKPLRVERVAGTTEYTVTLPNGNRQSFDDKGKLSRITAPTGEFVMMQRDLLGFLMRVTDPQGRSLFFKYLSTKEARTTDKYRGVQSVDSPVGRFAYSYGGKLPEGSTAPASDVIANLVKVSLPTRFDKGTTTSTVSRIYHYENSRHPTLLTGISVQGQGSDGKAMNERLVTWGYDTRGRANLSVKGVYDPKKPGPEQVTLAFDQKPSDGSGTATLTNSLGQTTRYSYKQINGKPQLLEVRGAGCATCGAVNVQYRYDDKGRRTHEVQLDAQGKPVAAEVTEYDGVDRVIRVSVVRYRDGKAGAPQLLVRYEFREPEDTQPALIARPSVVAGKEHQTRFTYNAHGQVAQITESGYEPLEQRPITRSTRYAYAQINNRSVLQQIDGPLPNGRSNSPADSDITRIDWDARGSFIASIEEPGARRSKMDYANTGLIAEVRNAQGAATRFDYLPSEQLERISTNGPGWKQQRVQIFKYDALGRMTEGGEQGAEAQSYLARFAQGYDIADRLQWRASRLGMLEQHSYDTESRVVRAGRYSNSMAQTLDYDFDEQGRLSGVRDASGAAYRFSYTAQGRIARVTDGFGDLLPQPSPASLKAARAVKPRKLFDDFGRVVAIISPDSGRTLRGFDEAGRMVSSQDALGNQARYDYDLQGRILRQIITDALTQRAVQTRWHYEGAHLVRLEHPEQDERYAYDARGLRIRKTVTLKTPGGERSSTTRYDYDALGTLQATSLPDGSHVVYERNGQGQVVALYRQRIQTPWLRWALPGQVIVKDLQRDIVGIKSYVTGNGIAAQSQRSSAGVLARMVYRNTREPRMLSANVNLPGITAAHAGTTETPKPPGAMGVPTDPQALMDRRYLWDTRGNLLARQDNSEQGVRAQSYAYDLRNRLIASASDQEFSRFAYDALGRRVLAQQAQKDQASMQGTVKTGYVQGASHRWTTAAAGDSRVLAAYDANGQPQSIGKRAYTWDALGRLQQIAEGDKVLAAYSYNHRGERIAKSAGQQRAAYLYEDKQLVGELDGAGHLTRQYIYLADTPIAAIETPTGVALANDDAWDAAWKDLRTIAVALFTTNTTLVWLHPNHLGAPEAVTDREGKLIWQASYAPFGQAQIKSANFALNIRLPGQYEDAESGLYYNRQRYYDPDRGQYLSPDPLGTPDGPNGYAYVRHNPLKYVDPDGLVLFAFDGTGNDESDPATLSNVVAFRDLYQSDDGRARYVTGVGTVHRDPTYGDIAAPFLDAGGNFSGRARITRMIRYFEDEANVAADEISMDVDIIGFSRGAAQARDFANRLVSSLSNGYYQYETTTQDGKKETRCQRVNFRFLGLFDTVLSTDLGTGENYNLAIPTQFAYVTQAVALNEHRGGTVSLYRPASSVGAFPLESIMQGQFSTAPVAGQTRTEKGFLGSHSDIGGGYAEGDLSRIALDWMVSQARLAGIQMADAPNTIIANPVLHDKSNAMRYGEPQAGSEDRTVRYRDGSTTTQRNMVLPNSMTYADTQNNNLITYGTRYGEDYSTGTVNAQQYIAWLNANGYNINVRVQ